MMNFSPETIILLTVVFNSLLVLIWTRIIVSVVHIKKISVFIRSKAKGYDLSKILVRPSVELFLMSFAAGSIIPLVIYNLTKQKNPQLLAIIAGSTFNCLANVASVVVAFIVLPLYFALSAVIIIYFIVWYIVKIFIRRWKYH